MQAQNALGGALQRLGSDIIAVAGTLRRLRPAFLGPTFLGPIGKDQGRHRQQTRFADLPDRPDKRLQDLFNVGGEDSICASSPSPQPI